MKELTMNELIEGTTESTKINHLQTWYTWFTLPWYHKVLKSYIMLNY